MPIPSSFNQLFACLRTSRADASIEEIARDFSPRIERHGTGCVVLDVSGLGRLLGDAHAIGAELERAASERSARALERLQHSGAIRVAVAPTQVAALLLTIARPGLTVVSKDVATALAELPLAVLPQLLADLAIGTGQTTRNGFWPFDVLQRWGLKTLGELAALPPVDLSERIGQSGLALQRLACGRDPAPLVPDPDVPRFVQSMELEWPIEQLEALSFVLARLLDPLSTALERADRGAAAIRVELRLIDRTVHARMLQLPAPIRDPRVLRTLVLLDLESHPPGEGPLGVPMVHACTVGVTLAVGIDGVSVEIDPAPARVIQYSLLERARPSPETVATLTARLGALVGESRCGSPALLDTHRPDGFEMRRFTGIAAPVGPPFGSGAIESATIYPEHAQPDRLRQGYGGPLELHAKAEGRASSGSSKAPSLRRFRPPIAARVAVERARPVAVAIDRRGISGGRVTQAAGPWRTSGAWWDSASTRWDRDEWDVALSDGSLCRLFRDRGTETWFMEGVID